MHAGRRPDGRRKPVNDLEPAALREVRDDLDQLPDGGTLQAPFTTRGIAATGKSLRSPIPPGQAVGAAAAFSMGTLIMLPHSVHDPS